MIIDHAIESRPYRPNVGICLFNNQGHVWAGRCISSGPEIVTPGKDWQLPQGGIEENEDIVKAASRELYEETGIASARLLDVTDQWWAYDFPVPFNDPNHKLTPYRGQKQKWVALLFEGDDSEITIAADHVDEPQEFLEWRWQPLEDILGQVVDFKRARYQQMVNRFAPLAGQIKRREIPA